MKLIDCYSELLAYTVYVTGLEPSAAALPYQEARERYEGLCGRAEAMRIQGGVSDRDWREGLFAICALIDEMILCSAWPGRGEWQMAQLQHRFFNTTNAGAEFFEHLRALTPEQDGVREVYGWCLAMGFKGAYFRPDDGETLEEISRANLDLTGRNFVEDGIPRMFPDAYGVDGKKRRKGMGATIAFTVLTGIVPVLVFLMLFVFYNNILKGILAGYFQ